jgi:hypothetical protein
MVVAHFFLKSRYVFVLGSSFGCVSWPEEPGFSAKIIVGLYCCSQEETMPLTHIMTVGMWVDLLLAVLVSLLRIEF